MTAATSRLDLAGRTALVCGSSKGIGRATAILMARRGAKVIMLARSEAALTETAEMLRGEGCDVSILVADLDDRDDLLAKLDGLLEQGPIHIVVHNTGGPKGGPLHKAALSELEGALGRHVFSAHVMMQKVLPGMTEAGYGRWINVLSTSVREPIPNLGVSNLTRAAMASWAKTLSREFPQGVTINNVLPGFTDTDRMVGLASATADRTGASYDDVRAGWIAQVPEGRLADPAETAEAICFLASEAGAYVRGHSLPVDGGRLRSIS